MYCVCMRPKKQKEVWNRDVPIQLTFFKKCIY